MLKAQVAGHVCVDLIPALSPHIKIEPGSLLEVGPMHFSAGGCVANTGTALAELGAVVHATAQVGTDFLGTTLATLLRGSGMVPELIRDSDLSTSYSIVLERPMADGTREDRTFWHHVGANSTFDGVELLEPGWLRSEIEVLHLGYPPLLPGLLRGGGAPLVRLLKHAKSLGITTSVDMVVVDPDSDSGSWDWPALLAAALPYIDIFCPSVDDLRSAFATHPEFHALTRHPEDLASALVDMGAAVVMLTDGPGGFLARAGSQDRLKGAGRLLSPVAPTWADASVRQDAHWVEEVVTTNAAGDVSAAGLLAAIHRGHPTGAALEEVAKIAAAHVGGFPLRSGA